MPKNQNKKTAASQKIIPVFIPFQLTGRLVIKIMQIYKNAYLKILYVLTGFLELLGRLVVLPFKITAYLGMFLLEKIGKLTIFLLVLIIRLPTLPLLIVWELWLIATKPAIRKQKLVLYQKSLADFRKSFRRSFKNAYNNFQKSRLKLNRSLQFNPDPGVRFLYTFVCTPARTAITFSVIFIFFNSVYYWIIKDLPSPYRLKNPPILSTKIYARDCETLLYKVYRNENRSLVPLEQIPDHVKKATIAIEDKEFYKHHGYSLAGIFRALKNNLKEGRIQGGSTITQQLIKNTVLSSERTYERKIKELLLSIQTEIIFSKDQILQMYLNEVPYGGPAYGIEEASLMYFGKSVRDIDLAEAAFLAGLPAAPSNYSPYLTSIETAKERQKEVLRQMVKAGFINADQARDAYAEKIHILPPGSAIKAPHFVMYVRDELIKQYGQKKVEEGGLKVCTSLDPKIQKLAETVVKQEVEKVRKPYRINNGAALVTNPQTGEILAMVGSTDYWNKDNDGNVNLTTALRQPGSSIKLVNYSYALGHGYTPNSILMDTPISYSNAWETYTPKNYDGKFRGRVTLREALAMSLNVPAVKVLASYGPDKMKYLGERMGITTWKNLNNYGLSLTLGAAEVKMTDMAVVYGTLANQGRKVSLKPFVKITDAENNVIFDINKKESVLSLVKKVQAASDEFEQVIPETVAYQLVDILSDNKARTPAFGPNSDLYIKEAKVAVKTGTSNEMRDNWTIGLTPNLLVATWVGNNDNQPMSHVASGITGASPIWNKIITSLIKEYDPGQWQVPEGMIKVKICAANGLLTCNNCPEVKEEWFVPGTEPKVACNIPSPAECQAKKAQLEAEGKKPEEIVEALKNCPLAAPSPTPQ
jgi:1A family penicillin-binding protein